MPKERKTRSVASEIRCKASPYKTTSPSRKTASPEEIKEWDEVRCPICMEQPHNAVLLSCSSCDKGCRPFMCDTSYRHSNCLDQYRKAVSASKLQDSENSEQQGTLTCPLCRGLVTGWTVVESARSYMNDKIRSCSKESCGFTGIYGELRKHARKEHPSVRPAEADPERQQDWRRMEQQRDLADLFSMLHSVITGDEVGISIEEDNEEERSDDAMVLPSITVLVFVQVHRTRETASGTGRSPLHGSSSPRSYPTGSRRTRAFIWRDGRSDGTSLARVISDEQEPSHQTMEEPEEVDEDDDDAPTSRGRRRRIVRMSDDEEDDVS